MVSFAKVSAEPRKKLREMNNAELTLYGHQARGGRDQPEFQKIITDENGNRQTVWGSEVSMQEILEIQQANLNHPEEGKRKLFIK